VSRRRSGGAEVEAIQHEDAAALDATQQKREAAVQRIT
jgi:hypothetical protein